METIKPGEHRWWHRGSTRRSGGGKAVGHLTPCRALEKTEFRSRHSDLLNIPAPRPKSERSGALGAEFFESVELYVYVVGAVDDHRESEMSRVDRGVFNLLLRQVCLLYTSPSPRDGLL